MCPHLRIEDRISKMKVMQKDNMTVRSWRRLHRRRVLLAAAALCAICAMGLAAWYWLSPRIYEAKRSLSFALIQGIRYGASFDY